MVEFLNNFYNGIFSGLLTMNGHVFGAQILVAIFAVVISIISSLIYKYLADQGEIKKMRENLKGLKKKMDEAKKKNQIKDMSKYMNESLELNHKMMKKNLKPMLASFVFIFLFLPWLQSSFDQTVAINENFSYSDLNAQITNNSENILLDGKAISKGDFVKIGDSTWEVKQANEDGVRLTFTFIKLPFSLPLVGSALEWLGFYILISIPATMISRKWLGVH